jgi:hypothetical protein
MRSVAEIAAFSGKGARSRASSQADDRGERAPALFCVWVETGNPARPLACRWYAGDMLRRVPMLDGRWGQVNKGVT